MAKAQDVVLYITCTVQMIISFTIIGTGPWLHNSCVDDYGITWDYFPALGFFMSIAGIFGWVGLFGKYKATFLVYLVSMFFVLLSMLGFIVFLFVVTRYSSGPPHQPNHKEYRVDHFSPWYRRRLCHFTQWNQIVYDCLAPSDEVCPRLDQIYLSSQQLFSVKLTPLQYGCCMPPPECGYTYVSPTKWTSSTKNQTNPDCAMWSNDPRKLCYYCDSCKAGTLATVTKTVKTANLLLLVTFVPSVIIYVFHCCLSCIMNWDDDE